MSNEQISAMQATNRLQDRHIIKFRLHSLTTLHVGSGQDRLLDKKDLPNTEAAEAPESDATPFSAALVLDREDLPCIPGSTLKGVLRERAGRMLPPALLQKLFGSAPSQGPDGTDPGILEVRTATWHSGKKLLESRSAIDRASRTVADKKLFNEDAVLPGADFDATIIINGANTEQLAALHAVLMACNSETPLQIGAHGRAGWGETCVKYIDARVFDAQAFEAWWNAGLTPEGTAVSWEDEKFTRLYTLPAPLFVPQRASFMSLNVSADVIGPFAVRNSLYKKRQESQRNDRETPPDTIPRMIDEKGNSARAVLPSTSLLGALRSQAERILRTLHIDVPQGHMAPPAPKNAPPEDLVSLIFGCAGWRGILGVSGVIHSNITTLTTQELVAVCRFTGGTKDNAKFKMQWLESPTFPAIQFTIDFDRITSPNNDKTKKVCELLTLLWRDWLEGDIYLGMGRSKGWGKSKADQKLSQEWEKVLKKLGVSTARLTVQSPQPVTTISENILTSQPQHRLSQFNQGQRVPHAPAANNTFHNPYAFVPFGENRSSKWQSWAEALEVKNSPNRHDHYSGFSGEIHVELTTITSTFIGAGRSGGRNGNQTTVDPYERHIGKDDVLAIPGTSLRGMVSSVHEALTSSNMRILNDSLFSIRATAESTDEDDDETSAESVKLMALSALGKIVDREDGLYLEPLCPPALNLSDEDDYEMDTRFNHLFDDGAPPNLALLVDLPDNIVHSTNPDWYVIVPSITWESFTLQDQDDNWVNVVANQNKFLRFPNGGKKKHVAIGADVGQCQPIKAEQYAELPSEEQQRYTRGYIRTLRDGFRKFPENVKHYSFIPYPLERDTWDDEDKKLVKIPESCINTFHELADQVRDKMGKSDLAAADESKLLPYVPAGRQKNPDLTDRIKSPNKATRLQDGDLVYFDVNNQGEISEVSFSAIWRRAICRTTDRLPDAQALSPLKLGDMRKTLSPTEWMFGVVRQKGRDAPITATDTTSTANAQNRSMNAWAGKVVIRDALPVSSTVRQDEACILKELSSPKPPAPAFYMKAANPAERLALPMKKAELSRTPNRFTLQGRKHYLHAKMHNGDAQKVDNNGNFNDQGRHPWISEFNKTNDRGNKRRVKVEPIAKGQRFRFVIEFDQFSQTELEDLLATLLPSEHHHHKIGMGKPLGMGSIKLDVLELKLINRYQRYAQDNIGDRRHHWVWIKGGSNNTASLNPFDLAAKGMTRAHPDVRRALQLLGDPQYIEVPVHYPQQPGRSVETQNFRWFVANENKDNPQHIAPLGQNSTALPKLRR